MVRHTINNDVQELTGYLRHRMQELGLKKRGDFLFAPFLATREYRRKCTIKEFLYDEIKMAEHFDLWCSLTRFRHTANTVVAVLEGDADDWDIGVYPRVIRLRYPM